MKELGPLPEDLRDFLDAERDLEAPAPHARERMFARLAPFVLPTGAGAGAGGAGAAGSSSLLKAARRGQVILSLVSATIGAAGGAAMHAALTSPKAQPVVMAPQEISPQPVAPVLAPSQELAPPPEPTLDVGATGSGAAASGSARAEPRAKGSGTLLAERLLIESATEAITRGDQASAIAALQRHAREFPKGQLVQEREALMIQALRASGDDAAAQQRAKDFKRKFPGSLQQGTVDKASNQR